MTKKRKYITHYSAQAIGVVLTQLLYMVYWSFWQPDKANYVMKHLAINAIPHIIISLCFVHIYNYIITKKRSIALFSSVALVLIIISPGIMLVITQTLKWLIWRPGFEGISRSNIIQATGSYFIQYIISTVVYLLTYYWLEYQNQREKTLQAIMHANEAQLKMLQYQINPHFLFNALNAIQSMIEKDKSRAKNMIADLSDFFRYSLSINNQMETTLYDELEAARKYLAIQKERFANRLIISYEIDKSALGLKIPPFIIHPLVENAIKYGYSNSNDILQLLIRIEKKNKALIILVKNSGTLRQSNQADNRKTIGTKTGIENIKKRLLLLYPDNHELELSEKNNWVSAKIIIRGV